MPLTRTPLANHETAWIIPRLSGVAETMLWALHHRASEATRPDGVLADPDSARIRAAIDYDFIGRFGTPAGSLGARAAAIDGALRYWLSQHPAGVVVSLGEGLETQARRVDNGQMRWLSVDLPEAICLRERFLPPTDRFRHVAVSALDETWMDAVDPSASVFVVAQGLLMYLEPTQVRQLFKAIATRFPGAEMVFDVVPRWFANLTLEGLNQTALYRLPPMPWGINQDDVETTLRHWHIHITSIAFLDYRMPRGLPLLLAQMVEAHPLLRHEVPSLVKISFAAGDRLSTLQALSAAQSKALTAASRNFPMTANNGDLAGSDTLCGVLALAAQNAGRGGKLAIASSQIVAKRVALGVTAMLDPLQADHAEFGRMVPEKVEAFSTAGRIALNHSSDANLRLTRLASDEVFATARAAINMASCATPVALAQAQMKFAIAWVDRATANFFALGTLALKSQDAVMAPLRDAVAINGQRLVQA